MAHLKQHSFTANTDHDFTGLVSGQLIQFDGTGLTGVTAPTSGSLWSASTGTYSIINNNGGGNVASATNAIVVNGYNNTAAGNNSAIIASRDSNTSYYNSFVAGGHNNTASYYYAAVVGGFYNTASAQGAGVFGGRSHTASTTYSAVLGGRGNAVLATESAIAGGQSNRTSGIWGFVGGGFNNVVVGASGGVVAGRDNRAEGDFSFVGGGRNNTVSGNYSAIIGGLNLTNPYDYTLLSTNITAATMSAQTVFASTLSGLSPVNINGAINVENSSSTLLSLSGDGAFTLGLNASTTNNLGISIGNGASSDATADISIGAATVARGGQSIAIGRFSESSSVYDIAIGSLASATGNTTTSPAIAIGRDSGAIAGNAIAIGYNTNSSASDAIAIGRVAQSTNSGTIAIGQAPSASGNNSIAIGTGADSTGTTSIAIGNGAQSKNLNTVAIGGSAEATGEETIAIGDLASATGQDAIAIGSDASTADGLGAVSLGRSANSSATGDIAIGRNTIALGDNTQGAAIAIGASAEAEPNFGSNNGGSISIGYQAGLTASGSRNVNSGGISIGHRANRSSSSTNTDIGSNSIAIGRSSRSTGATSIAIGQTAFADNDFAIAVGRAAQATGERSIMIGMNDSLLTAQGMINPVDDSVAFGWSTSSGDVDPSVLFAKTATQYIGGSGELGIGVAFAGGANPAQETLHVSGGTIRINTANGSEGNNKIAVSDASGSISFSGASDLGLGGGETLAETLAIGNTTGANNIIVSSGAYLGYSDSGFVNRFLTNTITSNRTQTLQDKTGTLAHLDDIDITRVQPGTNITTGGTDNLPSVSLSDDIVLNSINSVTVSATTMSAQTVFITSNRTDTSGTAIEVRDSGGTEIFELRDSGDVRFSRNMFLGTESDFNTFLPSLETKRRAFTIYQNFSADTNMLAVNIGTATGSCASLGAAVDNAAAPPGSFASISMRVYGDNYLLTGGQAFGNAFYQNKAVISTNQYTEGTVLKYDGSGTGNWLYFEASGVIKALLDEKGNFGLGLDLSGSTAPNSMLQVDGSVSFGTTSASTNYNTGDEVFIGINDTSSPRTVTIQTSDIVEGRIFVVKDESGGAGTNNITIATQGSQTIDGASTITITSNYGVGRMYVGRDGNLYTW